MNIFIHTLGSLLARHISLKLLAEDSKLRYDLVTRNLARYISGATAHASDIPLSALTVEVMVGFRDWSLLRVQPTTFNTERRHLSAMFNGAVRHQIMASNPFRDVPGAPVPKLLPKSIPKPEFLAALRLLETGKRRDRQGRDCELIEPQWFWLAVLRTFYFTGMRKRQLLGLRWGDIDFAGMTIKLRAATSKTRREWLVPLPIPLVGDLERLRRRTIEVRGETPAEAQVFCLPMLSTRKRTFSSREMKADNLDNFFQRLRRLLPRDSPRISAHRIRHTTATILANSVTNLKVVQEQLGHSSILTTYGYVHPDLESMRKALTAL